MANKASTQTQKQQANKPAEQKQGNKPPAHEVRLGRIRCTIWENHHEKSGKWFSMTLSRTYKDDKGQLRSATSFGRDDLLSVGEVCRRALWWIQEQYSKTAQQNAGSEHEEASNVDGNSDIPF